MLRLILGSLTPCLLAISASAQSGAPQGVADLQPGGEWAIGRWEGNLVEVGTSAGTAGLNQVGRVFIVERTPTGARCYWFIPGTAKSPTKQCTIGAKSIALVTVASSKVELWRTSPDAMQGKFEGTGARVAQGAGTTGRHLFLNRIP